MDALHAILAAPLVVGVAAPLAQADTTALGACDVSPEGDAYHVQCEPGPDMYVCVPPKLPACRP